MRKPILCASYLVAAVLASSAASADVVRNLDFSVDGVLPSAEPDIDFVSHGTESELFFVSGDLLQQRTFGKPVSGAQYSFPDGSLTGGGLDVSASLIMEARFRILDIVDNGAFFGAHDSTNDYRAFFFPAGVQLSDLTFIPLEDMSQFHTYKIVSFGNDDTYAFFMDGELLATASAISTNFNGFQWGDAGGQADVDWDFVRFSQPMSLGPPLCDVELSQTVYIDGEMVTADVLRIANPGLESAAVEIKTWLATPDANTVSIINAGANGSIVLPSGADIDLGPLPLLPVTPGLPRGTWELDCRLLDPVTGGDLAVDVNPFEVE